MDPFSGSEYKYKIFTRSSKGGYTQGRSKYLRSMSQNSNRSLSKPSKAKGDHSHCWHGDDTARFFCSRPPADMKKCVLGPPPSGNSIVNLRHLFQVLLVEKSRVPYRNWVCLCPHVLSRLPPGEHDLRLLRRALFPGRY